MTDTVGEVIKMPADGPADAERDWRPGYVRAAEDLRDRILNGEFAPGTAIPSEPRLVDRYGISRTSIRNAVRQLRDWGLVEARQGAGTYVLARAEALFDGVVLDGPPDEEHSITDALLALDPRYIRCTSEQQLAGLLSKGRIPIVHVDEIVGTDPQEASPRWLNALLWSSLRADATVASVAATSCILAIRTDVTPAAIAARAIHAVVTA